MAKTQNRKTIEERIRKAIIVEYLDELEEWSLAEGTVKAMKKLISDILREAIGEGDDNPKYGGMVNFASNAPEEKDVLEAKSQAFEYGFRMGWRTCWFEIRRRARKLGLEV